jgi:outer membrane protein OmpA-like peptidoglycan-associated protein
MKTKPVFESFNAFVDFLKYDSVNEGAVTDWKGILSSLSGFWDDDARKGIQSARMAYDKAPTYQGKFKKDSAAALKEILTGIDDSIERNTTDNQDPKKMQMSEGTTTEVKTITYTGLINGKVKIATPSDYYSNDKAGASLQSADWVDLNDFISKINLSNLAYGKYDPNALDLDKKYGKWETLNDTDLVAYSGPYNQDYISSVSQGISIGDFGIGSAPKKILPSLNFKSFQQNKSSENPIKSTIILYGIGNVVQGGGGEEIPDYFVKKDFIKETVQGESKEYNAQIDGGDAMFKQGSAEINVANKEKIDQMITAALAPLAGSPESIEITGGASFEGGLELNKKLVVERANAVKAYMEKLYPALVGKIKVNETDFSKIQPKDEKDKYEEWRKVHLKIKGVLQGDSFTIEKPINITVNQPIMTDSVEIIQYAISFEYSIPNFKPAKK